MLIGLSAASSVQAITYNAGTLSTTPYISTPTVFGAFSDRYDFTFRVQGTADGVGSGAGIYAFTAAAVPEADTYAMPLASLALVGYSVSRRKRNFS